jgi:hypothetical protein
VRIIRGLAPRVLAQGFLERCRPAMLFQKIREGFFGQTLKTLLVVPRERIKRKPSLVIEA